MRFYLVLLICSCLVFTAESGGVVQVVVDGLIGSPEFHKEVKIKLDPYVGSRRAAEFQALHGDKGVNLIQRLGLGLDGRQEERLQQQIIRDSAIPFEHLTEPPKESP